MCICLNDIKNTSISLVMLFVRTEQIELFPPFDKNNMQVVKKQPKQLATKSLPICTAMIYESYHIKKITRIR